MIIVKVKHGKKLKYRITQDAMEELYKGVRDRKDAMRADVKYPTDAGMKVSIRYGNDMQGKLAKYRLEFDVNTLYGAKEEGKKVKHTIVFAWRYAVFDKDDGCTMTFFNENEEMVAEFKSEGGFKCKASVYYPCDEYIPIVVLDNGGCIGCDYSLYEKENDVWYYKCTKYYGRVEEATYDGLQYPEYCRRKIGKGEKE